MAAPMLKTSETGKKSPPNIFRRGGRYVVVYRDADGRQRKESARTLDDARRLLSKRTTQVAEGEFNPQTRVTLGDYAREWIDRYQGGRRGFREETREEYRGLLDRYAVPYFARVKLTALSPQQVAQFVGWLCDGRAQAEHAHNLARDAHRAAVQRARARGEREPRRPGPLADDATRDLADKTIRNIMGPLRKCLDTARREGLIRHNPATDIELPNRPQLEDDDGEDGLDVRVYARAARCLSRDRASAPPPVLRGDGCDRAAGVRGDRASVAPRPPRRQQAAREGAPAHPARQGRPGQSKTAGGTCRSPRAWSSSYASVDATPLSWSAARRLASPVTATWCSRPRSLRCRSARRTFAGASSSPRSRRPTPRGRASMRSGTRSRPYTYIDRGTNIVQLSRLLGHHAAGFTLSVYGHLMDEGVGAPLDLAVELAEKWQRGGNRPHRYQPERAQVLEPDLAA